MVQNRLSKKQHRAVVPHKRKSFLSNTIFELVPESLVVINNHGHIVKASNSTYKLFNVNERHRTKRHSIFSFILPASHTKVSENLSKLTAGSNNSTSVYQLITYDGNTFSAEVKAASIKNKRGGVNYLLLTIRSVEVNSNSQNTFIQSDVLNLLAHELRQPLNSIIGFSMLIEQNIRGKSGINTEKLIKHNHIVTQQGAFLQHLVEQIHSLAVSNHLQVSNSTFNINLVLDELYEVFSVRQSQLNKTDIELHLVNVPANTQQQICTDEVKLKQIFTNIIFNAFKYTHKGAIRFGFVTRDNSTVTFFVSDTGVGIPASKYETVFNKYSRLDSSPDAFGSIGIGLALTQKIISALNGRIWFESVLDTGTTFYFTIPTV